MRAHELDHSPGGDAETLDHCSLDNSSAYLCSRLTFAADSCSTASSQAYTGEVLLVLGRSWSEAWQTVAPARVA